MIINVGGGSIDISSYNVNSTLPLEVEEFHEPKCEGPSSNLNIRTNREIGSYQGGEVVTARFREWAKCKFELSCVRFRVLCSWLGKLQTIANKTDQKNVLETLTKSFDGMKATFSDKTKYQFLKFGSPRETHPRISVRNGKLSVLG